VNGVPFPWFLFDNGENESMILLFPRGGLDGRGQFPEPETLWLGLVVAHHQRKRGFRIVQGNIFVGTAFSHVFQGDVQFDVVAVVVKGVRGNVGSSRGMMRRRRRFGRER
jgi:hypothetical protein